MASSPRTFVIGESDSLRTKAFFEHAKALGFEVELSPAVILKGNSPWSAHYDHPRRVATMGYGLLAGEVGCFLAHRQVWQKIVDGTDRVCLVHEDDARWNSSPDSILNELAQMIEGRAMVVRLVSEPQRDIRLWRHLSDGSWLGLPTIPGNVSVAYFITREAAVNLLKFSETFVWPIDNFLNFSYLHGVDALHLAPEKVRHADAVSMIGVRTKPTIRWHFRLKREVLRLYRTLLAEWAYQRALTRLGIRFARTYRSGEAVNRLSR